MTKNRINIWSLNVFLGIYWGNTNTKRYIHPNVQSSTIYISQDMEETQVSTTDDWLKKIWYTYTMEYYSAIKMNEILTFAAMRMDLENTVFGEMSQKDKYYLFFFCRIYKLLFCRIYKTIKINLHIKQKQIHRQRKKFMDIKGEREVGRD